MSERLLPVSIVAKRLNLSTETVRRYIRAGILPAVRVPYGRRGGNYLIHESAVAAFPNTTSCDSSETDRHE